MANKVKFRVVIASEKRNIQGKAKKVWQRRPSKVQTMRAYQLLLDEFPVSNEPVDQVFRIYRRFTPYKPIVEKKPIKTGAQKITVEANKSELFIASKIKVGNIVIMGKHKAFAGKISGLMLPTTINYSKKRPVKYVLYPSRPISANEYTLQAIEPEVIDDLHSQIIGYFKHPKQVIIDPIDTEILDEEGHPIFTGQHLVQVDKQIKPSKLKNDAERFGLKIRSITECYKGDQRPGLEKALAMADGILFPNAKLVVFNQGTELKLSRLLNYSNYFKYAEAARYVKAAAHKRKNVNPGNKDNTLASWGNILTNVINSPQTGMGISVAIVDTGIDRNHPSFKGRNINAYSFVKDEDETDFSGHGTMVAGVACAKPRDNDGLRFGVAYNANLYSLKVLDRNENGEDGNVINAIDWAIENGINVINVSIVRRLLRKEVMYSIVLEEIASVGLDKKSIVVGAVGNHANRPYDKAPVAGPASCPSIIAVTAIDENLNPYYESNSQIEKNGPKVDIAGPGANILSCSIKNNDFDWFSGTSLAAPFVTGIAALYWERNPNASGREIWAKICQNAAELNHPAEDVGEGLVYID